MYDIDEAALMENLEENKRRVILSLIKMLNHSRDKEQYTHAFKVSWPNDQVFQ